MDNPVVCKNTLSFNRSPVNGVSYIRLLKDIVWTPTVPFCNSWISMVNAKWCPTTLHKYSSSIFQLKVSRTSHQQEDGKSIACAQSRGRIHKAIVRSLTTVSSATTIVTFTQLFINTFSSPS